jgi:hypothetical protein
MSLDLLRHADVLILALTGVRDMGMRCARYVRPR